MRVKEEEMSVAASPLATPRSAGDGAAERIRVSVRLRPMNSKETENGDSCEWECVNDTTVVCRCAAVAAGAHTDRAVYSFDRVFGSSSSTRQVYEEGAKEVALSVLSGINSSIFAYGQTSSGKTHTMTGITEFCIADIYDYIEKHKDRKFTLKFSAVEIYNEAVRDLLSSDSTSLRLLDDPEKGTVIDRLTEETLQDQEHLKELLTVCSAQRQIGETNLNETSSRSHQILRLTVESSSRDFFSREGASSLIASVNFVDLAGSERASQVSSASARLKEGSHINRSLLTLGTVIRKLSKGRTGHIPYRDSKLTRILQSSLGGNARTAIVCTMSPAQSHIEQSKNTLLFATCAKEVATNARVNVLMSDKAVIRHLQRELARLESELKHPGSIHSDELKAKEARIIKLETEKSELVQQRDRIQERLEELIRGVGDHQVYHQNTDLHSRPSSSHTRTDSGDALSAFEEIDYQDQDFLQRTSLSSMYASSVDIDGMEQLPESTKEGDQCKEIQCMNSNEDLNLSLPDDPAALRSEDQSGRSPVDIPCNDAVKLEAPDSLPEQVHHPQPVNDYVEDVRISKSAPTKCLESLDSLNSVSGEAIEVKRKCSDPVTDIVLVTAPVDYKKSEQPEQDDGKKGDKGNNVTSVATSNPSQWLAEFEKKRQEIIELWHECNVSIVHRTSFIVLFKGDPADSIYLEVEHRRLSFLKKSMKTQGIDAAASLKDLRRERDTLHKLMLKKLRRAERENIYAEWGIPLNTKQRRLQLSRRVWTSTDPKHVRESVGLVARLTGLLEPGSAKKEMFGLSLAIPAPAVRQRKSSSWLPGPF